MKKHARVIILALAAVALIASLSALYVHYQMMRDPTYTSFCDVSETVSCEAVLQSRFARVAGVPVAAGGAIWGALILLLALRGMGARDPNTRARYAGYVFLFSTAGLAVSLYLGYASFFILRTMCPLCLTMYVAVIGVFIVSGMVATAPFGTVLAGIGRDLAALVRNPVAATLAAVWLVGSISLIAFFPREQPVVATAEAVPTLPTETLQGDMLTEFQKWIDSQPRASLNVPADGARVVVVKFNDYQCPACRETYVQYKGIVAKYQSQYPGQVKFITKDFPLEAECNAGTVHPSACEAAAAVRMARAKNKAEALEEWLFERQETMTPQMVKEGLAQVAQVTDFDAQYPKILEEVKADAAMGRQLDIKATPTFFVNGIKVQGGLRPMYFDAMIAYELSKQ
jgi:uncharacterized membrane protein/predicted DsbA family dithiol-disulfide isomerase